MSEESKLETVEALIRRVGAALSQGDIEAVHAECARLGPHVMTLERNLEAAEQMKPSGLAVTAAGRRSLAEALGVMPIEKAAEAASALG